MDLLEGVNLTPLKIINNDKGDIMHALKSSEPDFHGFGEAYFSTINFGEIKGWKMHHAMIMNIVVPVGSIRFVLFDERPESKSKDKFWQTVINAHDYKRLTVPPLIWMAFQGLGNKFNLVLNIASIQHDPKEVENRNIEEINFKWDL